MSFLRRLRLCVASLCCMLSLGIAAPAHPETSEVRAAQQFGLSYLALMMMEDSKLVEKQAKAMGLGDIKVSWAKLGGPGAMNDALLSGGIDFGTGGVPSLITLWSKTHGTPQEVRGVGALNSMPVNLVTSNPNVKSIRDFTDKDKIAVTTVKVSTQALLLQMAAAKEFGEQNYAKLDPLTVSLPHPDAMTALLSGGGTITAHFSSPPFQYQEVGRPGIRTILSNYEILGGPATFNVVWSTAKFRDANPKTYAAFVAAFEEATATINRDKRAAAEVYKRMSGTKETVEELLKMMEDPLVEYTLTPKSIMKTAEFMAKVGTIKEKPSSWKDLFFPNVHGLQGS
ncbi:MAG: ABC transporter substrate-binding protein [Betaproteobacteria bacterium]|nr:MAG: ABC transporter substrate-binding protein [Betaproteobacteria bacterium]